MIVGQQVEFSGRGQRGPLANRIGRILAFGPDQELVVDCGGQEVIISRTQVRSYGR